MFGGCAPEEPGVLTHALSDAFPRKLAHSSDLDLSTRCELPVWEPWPRKNNWTSRGQINPYRLSPKHFERTSGQRNHRRAKKNAEASLSRLHRLRATRGACKRLSPLLFTGDCFFGQSRSVAAEFGFLIRHSTIFMAYMEDQLCAPGL